jgi:hypothetical protein
VLTVVHVINSLAFDWQFLNLNVEQNLPSWVSTLAFAIAGLASLAAGLGDRQPRAWTGVGVLMLAFSLDDVAMIHEQLEDAWDEGIALLVVEPVLAVAVVLVFAAAARTLAGVARRLLWGGLAALVIAQAASSAGFLASDGARGLAALATLEEASEMMMAVLILAAAVQPLTARARNLAASAAVEGGGDLRSPGAGGGADRDHESRRGRPPATEPTSEPAGGASSTA